jgi:hypothetical protein
VQKAQSLLAPLRPSCSELHSFIIRSSAYIAQLANTHPLENHVWAAFGLFITGGYALLPEREIVYDLETPDIRFLGYGLKEKHLIVNGLSGQHTGMRLCGELTINGTVGFGTGNLLVGKITCNGDASSSCGNYMIGELTVTNEIETNNFGTGMIGRLHTLARSKRGRQMLGEHNGSWNILPWQRKRFAEDLTHLDEYDGETLYRKFHETYRKMPFFLPSFGGKR